MLPVSMSVCVGLVPFCSPVVAVFIAMSTPVHHVVCVHRDCCRSCLWLSTPLNRLAFFTVLVLVWCMVCPSSTAVCVSPSLPCPSLPQIRLTLAKKDFVRALIQSRKINRKVLLDEDMEDIKV